MCKQTVPIVEASTCDLFPQLYYFQELVNPRFTIRCLILYVYYFYYEPLDAEGDTLGNFNL